MIEILLVTLPVALTEVVELALIVGLAELEVDEVIVGVDDRDGLGGSISQTYGALMLTGTSFSPCPRVNQTIKQAVSQLLSTWGRAAVCLSHTRSTDAQCSGPPPTRIIIHIAQLLPTVPTWWRTVPRPRHPFPPRSPSGRFQRE